MKIFFSVVLIFCLFGTASVGQNISKHSLKLPALAPIPEVPAPLPPGTVEMADPDDYREVKMDFPMMEGPFEPTWESIDENYTGLPEWLKRGKFGFWVHFGPQSFGESGDWYARRMYIEYEPPAYQNHLARHGHPCDSGYKDILTQWNPRNFDPARLVKLYKEAGGKFILVQGVHHDNYDMWNSAFQPWNSVNIGPKRDIMKEWKDAVKKEKLHFGIAFHHEYTWWWWQSSFWSDKTGPKQGMKYDGRLTLSDGKGTAWEGYDPRMLYGIDLNEYKGMQEFPHCPNKGIFSRHLEYGHWYANNWALRILDAINQYDPDFIYTDGTVDQPFSGFGTGTGYKCDAMQRVIASYYNQRIKRHGDVDAFCIVKFHKDKFDRIPTTIETWIPEEIKTDQSWVGENAVGDWYYKPGIVYNSSALIRYMLEIISRDGYYMVNIPFKPDGSIDEQCESMLKEVGEWMKINGEGIYGSRAWIKLGEGKDGKINKLPDGQLSKIHADHVFGNEDFRFTQGENGDLYAYCMTVPQSHAILEIKSFGSESDLAQKITSVKMLGHKRRVQWEQQADKLVIFCPSEMNFKTAVGFRISVGQNDPR